MDLPIEWIPALLQAIETATVRNGNLRFIDGVKGWNAGDMDELRPEVESALDCDSMPGPSISVEKGIFSESLPHGWVLRIHGVVKGSALMLGLAHHHEGDDLVITEGWEAMLDGLGFTIKGKAPMRVEDAEAVFKNRISELRNAAIVLEEEKKRKTELEQKRSTVRIAAETDARQRGLGIAETDKIGRDAANKLPDPGPKNPDEYLRAQILEDDHLVDGILTQVRQISRLRWEHSAPVRVGCRMGRPEKSAPREKPTVHSLFPIALSGGNQRLIANSAEQQDLRVEMGVRFCTVCEKKSPMINCHHRKLDDFGEEKPGEVCGGRTELRVSSEKQNARRRGELQTIRIDNLLEDARISLGIDRVPKKMKGLKKLMSKNQTPEAVEKGILRAKHGLPVFRDGTIRFDMSDVPVTHFTPEEIGVEWGQLKHLGYTHDCFNHLKMQ